MDGNKSREKKPGEGDRRALYDEHNDGSKPKAGHGQEGRSHRATREAVGGVRPTTPVLKRTVCYHILRLVLGGVFLYASFDKILHPQAFSETVYNYQVLPDAAVNLVALVLPWLEFLLGLCLVTGIWMPGAVLMTTGLLLVFIGALVFNLARGLDIHCGCFSTEAGGEPVGLMTVIRDLGFLALSVYLTVFVLFLRSATLKSPGSVHSPGITTLSKSRR